MRRPVVFKVCMVVREGTLVFACGRSHSCLRGRGGPGALYAEMVHVISGRALSDGFQLVYAATFCRSKRPA
jgi:hypothetical protein